MKDSKEAMDIDDGIIEFCPNNLEDFIYLQDLYQRKMYLIGDVEMDSIAVIIRNIIQINREDYGVEPSKRAPIYLYISSFGGDVNAGLALIDTICESKTPVYTVNIGYQYSMAFMIGLAGKKRFAFKNSSFLIHDGFIMTGNSATKVQDQMEFNKKIDDRSKEFILKHSSVSEEEFDSKARVEWYMFPDEAKEKGFIDYIVGEDCDFDNVI